MRFFSVVTITLSKLAAFSPADQVAASAQAEPERIVQFEFAD
jgi:hypothetical protein